MTTAVKRAEAGLVELVNRAFGGIGTTDARITLWLYGMPMLVLLAVMLANKYAVRYLWYLAFD